MANFFNKRNDVINLTNVPSDNCDRNGNDIPLRPAKPMPPIPSQSMQPFDQDTFGGYNFENEEAVASETEKPQLILL